MGFSSVNLRRLAARLLGAALLLAATAAMPPAVTPASAQGFGWFGNIFGGGAPGPRRVAPPRPSFPGYGYYEPPSNDYDMPRRRTHKPRVADQQPRDTKDKAPPKNASLFVDVFGDSLGQMLANGLDDALADRSDVAVIHSAKGGTGLVATSAYDWPKAIETLLAEDRRPDAKRAGAPKTKADAGSQANKSEDAKAAETGAGDDRKPPQRIDVAVMMIGSNDVQAISEGNKILEPGNPEWNAAYRKRVHAVDDAFKKKGIPLIWVGIPIVKDDALADDMAALNDIYRDVAAQDGATFVDTWEAFSDDDGDFSAFGPDVNGQVVRLRSADGIHFTKAGARKLAHFVEAHVRRALDGKVRPAELPTADTAKSPVAKAETGPIKNLNEAPTSADGKLANVALPTSLATPPVPASQDGASKQSARRVDDPRWANGAPEP